MRKLAPALAASLLFGTSGVMAEIVPLNDQQLGATTGQAGITIDFSSLNVSVGAVDYQDQGFLSFNNIVLDSGSFDGTGIDNLRLTVDVAKDSADIGTSALGAAYLASAGASFNVVEDDQNAKVSDGDLVISLRAIDDSAQGQSIDYGLFIESIALGSSTSTPGAVSGTTLVRNIDMSGYLGPIDIVFDNGNNGVNINAYFNAFGSLELPFMATTLDVGIHNGRGNEYVIWGTTYADTFAHVQVNVAAGVNGLALDILDFSADMDLLNIEMGGNGMPIGNIYVTDMSLYAYTEVYGH